MVIQKFGISGEIQKNDGKANDGHVQVLSGYNLTLNNGNISDSVYMLVLGVVTVIACSVND